MTDFRHAGLSARALNHSAQSIFVDSGKLLPAVIISGIFGVLGIAFGVMAYNEALDAKTEARMFEYYLLELDAKVIHQGIKDPSESIALKLERHREVEKK